MPPGLYLHGIKNSDRKDKRYKAKFCMCKKFDECKGSNTKEVHFGQKGGETYIDHGDKEKRENYLKRHSKNNKFDNDPSSAHALSKFLLWGDSTSLARNIAAFRKKFNL